MATPFMKDKQMNNWPNPNSLGEPKFPEIARTHFLSYAADKSVYDDLPACVKQDATLVGMWSPARRQWLFMTGDMLTSEQVAAECDYISPCYTEEEMRQAQISTYVQCAEMCDFIGDNAIDDLEGRGAYSCAKEILCASELLKAKESI